MKYKIKSLNKTCQAMPTQWEGYTVCGKNVYIRYRLGQLQPSVANNEDDAVLGMFALGILILLKRLDRKLK